MPIRLPYKGTPTRLAASLGDQNARSELSPGELAELDNAFEALMSCCDVATVGEDFAPPRFWPYTLEAAMRMAVAIYREFLPDWDHCYIHRRQDIPEHVPARFAHDVWSMVAKWILEPASFTWEEHRRAYCWIADDICLDGYLTSEFPDTPRVVACHCYSALYLIDVENCQPDAGPMVQEFNPQGIYAARTADVIGWFIYEGMDQGRMREAVKRELIPWCRGIAEPLRT